MLVKKVENFSLHESGNSVRSLPKITVSYKQKINRPHTSREKNESQAKETREA